jgi:RNA polymerase sigma-70 factor (ECF subfamily)
MTPEEIEHERPYLFGLAYRILGSAADAEDVLQEAFLKAKDLTDVRSPRAMLTTIVTRLCLDEVRSARRRREEYVGPWLPEPIATDEPRADQRAENAESVSMAFLVLLESLSPLERAVYVLREVLDLEYDEIAAAVGRSEAAVRQLLHRARGHVASRKPRYPTSPDVLRTMTAAFYDTLNRGDLDGLMKLLTADVTVESDHGGKARANLNTILGADRTARFLHGLAGKLARVPGARIAPWWINGAPGFVVFEGDAVTTAMVIDIVNDGGTPRIGAVHNVRNPDKLGHLAREIATGKGAMAFS